VIANWVSTHRRSILFLILLAVVAGLASGFTLPVALFPDVSFPRIAISIDAGDQPAEIMVAQVTRPVEQAVKSVVGVREVRSTTSRGSADISMNFDWGRDMNLAALQVQSAITRILPELPPGTLFAVRRMNPTVFPVAAYSLTSDRVDLAGLRDIAQYQLAPVLSTIPGVASVLTQGGDVREYRVEADPALLASYNVTIDDLTKALSNSNVLKIVGRIEDRHKLFLVTANAHVRSVDDIGQILVRAAPSGAVRISNVARVYSGAMPAFTLVTADGRPAVLLQVYQQPNGNTVQIVREVKTQLEQFRGRLPPGVEFKNWYDQSELITGSAFSVWEAILIGIALAGGVLFLFLRDRRITFVVLIVVPAVLSVTVLVLSLAQMSFNIMTLGGMAAAIGLIIDDAIVMIEHIARRLRDVQPEERHAEVRTAATEFFRPLAGSSAATVVIFVPLAFLGGVTGAFFRALSLTMASALAVSFVVAWIVIPLLADWFVASGEQSHGGEGLVAQLVGYMRQSDERLKRTPGLALALCATLFVVGAFAYTQVGSGFMPAMDEGGFVLDYIAPPGTSLKDTDGLLRQVEQILRSTAEVDTYSRRTGLQLGGGLTEANTGDIFVRLKPQPRRDIKEIMADVHQQVGDKVPGLKIELAQLMEDLIGDLTAVPQPIEVKLFGDDLTKLRQLGSKVADVIGKIGGVTEIKNGVVLAGDGLDIEVDPVRAGVEGLDPAAVAQQAEAYLAGSVATKVQQGERTIGVRVWVGAQSRASLGDIDELQIVAPDGHKVALDRIATVRPLNGEPEISRDNLKNVVPVTARIEGRDLGSTVADVKHALDASRLFSGTTYYELGGLYAEQQSAFRGLLIVIIAAFLLVFVLLLFLYERFDFALSIVAMPLLAMPAVFIGLWLTGIELNISAMMGMTMVVGIVTEVAIFYFSEFEELIAHGVEPEQARSEAAANRFRPIAMTTLAAILALLPLALGLGQGSAMQQPLAVAIISGLIVQMPLVLLVMPRLQDFLDRQARAIARR
jgi:CzcA family heavy metal efflux pump